MGDKFDSIFPPSNIANIIVVSGFMLVWQYAVENSDESQGQGAFNNKNVMTKNICQVNLLITKRNQNSRALPITIY
jgi:hypothetical protein